MQLHVAFDGVKLRHDFELIYLGVKLDRFLTYRKLIDKVRFKLATRNNLLRKLTGTSSGGSASCLRTTALALVYSCAEYCSSSWLNSAHAKKCGRVTEQSNETNHDHRHCQLNSTGMAPSTKQYCTSKHQTAHAKKIH